MKEGRAKEKREGRRQAGRMKIDSKEYRYPTLYVPIQLSQMDKYKNTVLRLYGYVSLGKSWYQGLTACTLSWSVMFDSLQPNGTVALQVSLSMGFPCKNTGVGCHFFLQGIFLTQGLKPHLLHLLHLQPDSLPLSYQQIEICTLFQESHWSHQWS